MKITRKWAMPSKDTFTIQPINDLIRSYIDKVNEEIIIDPFVGRTVLPYAIITNDIDPSIVATRHLDALDFLRIFQYETVSLVLYDPPYSPRQVSECYKKLGKTVNTQTTQASYWSKQKDEIARIVKPNGIVISCGWDSNGIGEKRGFEIIEILLVAHGGHHNDTIVTVEKKIQEEEE